ncbi:tRNA 2-thiocytidine(32) synthetase TtcA [Geobacter sp. FeAm09]|uniref:tRNA 2-thiocytidine(32) synthetase TtcA n=1 Tax=Geobacter sp. FeAm09 TaxID=2597769 RepID=UPI0011EC62F1|nr:tRNA 2-thiocytidine(32) synthetase TtcA [Geobacter sp. FeAm09]QEM69640.1 tRNA 2-thiocytidine(32) synthetase TtcA [Geobacter sp. FeAm09]
MTLALDEFKNRGLLRKLRHGVGRAVADFGLIEEGDRVAVAVSGGKDSYTLLLLLEELRRRAPVSFEIVAVNIDSGYPGYRTDVIERFLRENGFTYRMVPTGHYALIQEKRRPGSSYCSICARFKRGALYTAAQELGCNKLALGHHQDDFVETLLLNQFFVGSLKSMAASMLADNGETVVIRPLVYLPEEDIIRFSREAALPVVCCCCPVCGTADLQRKRMKRLLKELEKDIPHVKNSLLKAISNVHPRHLLDRRLQAAIPDPCASLPLDGTDGHQG